MSEKIEAKRDKTVCIIEGGGSRAAFAFGAAATLSITGQLPPTIFATSSGAVVALLAASGEIAAGTRFLLEIRKYVRLRVPVFDVERLVLDLDRRGLVRIDRLRERGIDLRVGALDAESGEPEFLPIDAHAPLAKLAATMSLPGYASTPIEVDGRQYCDGGPVALAVNEAEALGAKRGIAVLTRPSAYRRSPPSRWLRASRRVWGHRLGEGCRARYLARSEIENANRDAIFAPPTHDALSWMAITPKRAAELPKRTTRSSQRLIQSMGAGVQRAAELVAPERPSEVVSEVLAELRRGLERGQA